MISRAVRKKLDERYGAGDRDWAKSIESDELVKMISKGKMSPITKQKMDQVLDAIKKRDDIQFFLLQPANKKKIQATVDRGEFDKLADALEKMVIQASKK